MKSPEETYTEKYIFWNTKVFKEVASKK